VLFDPSAHEPLVDEAWDAGVIRAAIGEIAAEAEATFDAGWPGHPLDDVESRRLRTVYLGGAGVIRALDDLEARGLVGRIRDYAPYLERDYAPEFAGYGDEQAPSLLMGETGIRLVRQRLAPSQTNLDRLAELVHANRSDPRLEVMWGSPGTMLAAGWLADATDEERWRELWAESAGWLDEQWDPETGVWAQDLYGTVTRYLGPVHGFTGCIGALAVDPSFREVERRAADVLRRYAVEEDGLANWPPVAGSELRSGGDGRIRVQWCHGAPGMVASLARRARGDAEHDRLLRAGGELVWRAGPLTKGAGLCHGTAGNGYTFLALFERTWDELWLERARAFAMHAARQVARARAAYGRGRFTLWTGDLGTALYLADCLAGGGSPPLP
jgi:Lanthionine synthetase C-like protein